LNALKPSYGGGWQIVEKRVAVVKFRRNKCISENNSRVCVEAGASLSQLANLEEGGTAYIRDMGVKREVRIKHYTKITYMRGRL